MRTAHQSRHLTRVVPSLLLIGATAVGLMAADPTITAYTTASLTAPTNPGTVGATATPTLVFQWPVAISGFDPVTKLASSDDLVLQVHHLSGAAPTAVTIAKANVNFVSSTKLIMTTTGSMVAGDTLKVLIPAASHFEYTGNPTANTGTFTTSVATTGIARTNATTATVTVADSTLFPVGSYVTITDANFEQFNGIKKVVAQPLGTTFTFALASDPGAGVTAPSGKVNVPTTIYTMGGTTNSAEILSQLAIVTPSDDSQTTDRRPVVAATADVSLADKTILTSLGAAGSATAVAAGAAPNATSIASSSSVSSTPTITFTFASPAVTPHFQVGDVITVANTSGNFGATVPTVIGTFVVTVASSTTVGFVASGVTDFTGVTASTVTITAVNKFAATDLYTMELYDTNVAGSPVTTLVGTTTFPRGTGVQTVQVRPTADLAVGLHRYTVKVLDPVGHYVQFGDYAGDGGDNAVSAAVDQVVWDAPTVAVPTLVNGNYNYSLTSALAISGAKFGVVDTSVGPVGSNITVTVDGQAVSVLQDATPTSLTALNTGWYALIPTSIIGTQGTHNVVVTQLASTAGSLAAVPHAHFAVQPSITTAFTINNSTLDTTAPDQPVISSPLDGDTISAIQPALSGRAEPGSTVTVQYSSDNVTFTSLSTTVTANATTGVWSYSAANWISSSGSPSLTAPGTYYLRIIATDAAGNVSPQSSVVSVILPTDDVNVSLTATGATGRTGVPGIADGDWTNLTTIPVRVTITQRDGSTHPMPDNGTLTATDFTVTGGTLAAKTAVTAATGLAVASNVATMTVATGTGVTGAAGGFVAGDLITVTGSSLSYANGTFAITGGSTTTITYAATGADATTTTAATATGASVFVLTPSATPVTVTLPASKFTSTISGTAYDNKAASYTLYWDKVAPTFTPTIVATGGTSATILNANAAPNLILTFNEAVNFATLDTSKIHVTVVGTTVASYGAGSIDATKKIVTIPINLTAPTSATSMSLTSPSSLTAGIEAAVIADFGGNSTAASTLTVAAKTFDNTAPTAPVITSTISSANATKTSPIPFTITFPESVVWDGNGLTVVNGVAGAVTGTGAIYTVNVTPGEGIVKIALIASTYKDLAGNSSGSITTSYVTRTYDSTAPRIVNLASTASATTKLSDIPFTVSFSEAVSGLTTAKFTSENCDVLLPSGVAGALTGPAPFYSLIARIKPAKIGLSGVKARVILPAGAVTDGATNTSSSAGELVRTYDGLVPALNVSLTTPPTAIAPVVTANAGLLTWTLTYNKSVAAFDTTKVVVSGGTLVSATGAPGTTITMVINYGNAKGAQVGVTLLAGAATDTAGNASATDSTSLVYNDPDNG